MPEVPRLRAHDRRVIVKLLPSGSLRAAQARGALRPLTEDPATLHLHDRPAWYLAELPDGAATPWDAAHARVADQLGLDAGDVLFAEPDLQHDVYPDPSEPNPGAPDATSALDTDCRPVPQDATGGKPVGPGPLWHLHDDHGQLAAARQAVSFSEPRTRIAHLDTGYQPTHDSVPRHVRRDLERSFVGGEAHHDSARDPDRDVFLLDASGHGTGTLSLLAGRGVPGMGGVDRGSDLGNDLGGAPDAEILPLRIADRVVLFYTSAIAEALTYATRVGCDVASLSMGGLPSRVWRETVDDAYLRGMCLVAAAGNNVAGLPTRHVVYPARYGRVIAACGVMADGRPYDGLHGLTMQGNHGPASVMTSALAASTPNVPWAAFGCHELARLNGQGTSAATPQIAAAAALWLERYKDVLPRDWRRVEAVRHALFESARPDHPDRLGRGSLRAADALAIRPRLDLPRTRSDPDAFAFLRVLTGLGLDRADPREGMFDLEIAQRWLLDARLQALVPDPHAGAQVETAILREVMELLIEDDGVSLALRRHLSDRYPTVIGRSPPAPGRSSSAYDPKRASIPAPLRDAQPDRHEPPYRRLRAYAVDPGFATRLDSANVAETTLRVPWEPLEPGPVGAYLAVDDVDASGVRYEAVDLDHPHLLAQDGWAPSEGNPQFHQQMTYAVAMTTLQRFEDALGRPVLWRPRKVRSDAHDRRAYVPRLTLRPHGLAHANAHYRPSDVSIAFGAFDAGDAAPGVVTPGARIHACLSHAIGAHELTHAVVDGMNPALADPSNPDVLALHEAVADVVALVQQLSVPDLLEHEIARSGGDLESETMLGTLAVRLGHASGRGGPLRDAIGTIRDGVWTRREPDPTALSRLVAPHARGAVLVAAVFDALLAIYRHRTADLFRIARASDERAPRSELHPDLVRRLAGEALTAARHVQTMCIRALDYLPPVDPTFFEYLRALITADADLVHHDRYDYRVAFVEAFRRHGIAPAGAHDPAAGPRTMSVDTLRWQGLERLRLPPERRATIAGALHRLALRLRRYADGCFYESDREALFVRTRRTAREVHELLTSEFAAAPDLAAALGLDPELSFEVAAIRSALRERPDGPPAPQAIVALTQTVMRRKDRARGTPRHAFRGGATVVVDLTTPAVRYVIVKNVRSERRMDRTARYLRAAAADPLRALVLTPDPDRSFAVVHALGREASWRG
ncbi:MAG: S8 family serine peptidase [Trueperaceae bacterium]